MNRMLLPVLLSCVIGFAAALTTNGLTCATTCGQASTYTYCNVAKVSNACPAGSTKIDQSAYAFICID
jgi:hypothetical protein